MKKTTEELAAKAGAILPKGVYPNGYLFYPFQLETFRNLVIQNELESAAPCVYQYRVKPTWRPSNEWQQWKDCSNGSYEDYSKNPEMNDWEYQTRKLFTFPPAQQETVSAEPVYAFRRKGLTDFCTCDREMFIEFSQKPKLFEVKMFFTFPPEQQEPVMVIGENDEAVCRVLQDGAKLFLEPPVPQPCPECEDRKTTALNYISLTFELEKQAAEITKLKGVIAKCEDALHAYKPCIIKFGLLFGTGDKALAAIKEIEK